MGWEEDVVKLVLVGVGAAVITLIGYIVIKKITAENIVSCIQKAIASARDVFVSQLAGRSLRGVITDLSGHAVTVRLEDLEDSTLADIRIKSVAGVDGDSLKVGDTIMVPESV